MEKSASVLNMLEPAFCDRNNLKDDLNENKKVHP